MSHNATGAVAQDDFLEMRACGGWCATGGGNVNANCGHTERVCLLVVVRWLEVGVLSCVGPGANMGIHAPLAAWMRAMQGAFSGSAYTVRPVCTRVRRAGRKASRAEGQAEVRLTPGGGGVTGSCSSLRIHTLLLRIHALVAFCYSLLSPVLPARVENQRHWCGGSTLRQEHDLRLQQLHVSHDGSRGALPQYRSALGC